MACFKNNKQTFVWKQKNTKKSLKIELDLHRKLNKNHAYDVGTWLKIIGRELRLKIIIQG